jgi:predicted P-loop ATPase
MQTFQVSAMVSDPSRTQNLPKGVSPEEYQPGSILDHLDKLEPAKGGKYICPVCGGNDLSIATKGKSAGGVTCHNNGCSWKQIMDAVAPLEKPERRGKSNTKATPKFKSNSQKDRDAIQAEIAIDSKVTEVLWEVENGSHSQASAGIAIATWAKEHGYNIYAVQQLLKEKVKTLQKLNRIGNLDTDSQSRLQKDYHKIENSVGEELAFDEATQNFYLKGEPLELDTARLTLSIDYGLNLTCGKEDISDICVRLSQLNRFNAVVDYLESCQKAEPIDLLTLAARLFGTTDPLHAVFLKKWLISAVARAYQPGVKSDDTLVLQGKQGQLKSSFFSGLVPNPEWFNANGLKGGKINEDEVRTAHRVWLIEVPEIDKLFKKACASELKAFMTLQREWIRPLYARLPVQLLRHSLMAGTTNEHEFFTDTTGNRRYWVIPLSVDKIDLNWVTRNRDRIWAAAVAAYKSGEPHWLSREEEQVQEIQNRQYQVEHPWLGLIEQYTHGLEEVTIGELLFRLLKIEIGKAGRSEQMQAAGILKSLGFQKTGRRKTIEDQRQTIWFRAEPEKGMDGMDLSIKEGKEEW